MTGMKLVFLIAATTTITAPFAAALAPDPTWLTGLGQLGSLGVLGWACWHLLVKTVPSQQETFRKSLESIQQSHAKTLDTIADRHERWEELRHKDSERLDATMQQMSASCAATQARMRQA